MRIDKYANVVLEMEGILLEPHTHGMRGVTGAARRIFKSGSWREYERGRLSRGEACRQLAQARGIPLAEVRAAARTSLGFPRHEADEAGQAITQAWARAEGAAAQVLEESLADFLARLHQPTGLRGYGPTPEPALATPPTRAGPKPGSS